MGLSQKFLTQKSWPPRERCQKPQILMSSKGVPEAGNSDAESNEKYAQELKTFEMSHWRELCVYSIALTPTQGGALGAEEILMSSIRSARSFES